MAGSHRRHERKKESKEERLLRKAKEFVQSGDREERRKRHHKEDRKERKRRRSDDSSEDSHHRKKRKHHERKDRKKKKHHKKESKKKRESSSSKKPNKKNLVPLGRTLGHVPEVRLDAEKDYFAYHQHLWVYLYREEGEAFNDLTADESREAFERFVQKYNAGELETAYYDPKGLPSAAIEECQTTRHSWSFRTSETEEKSLHALQEGVRKQTEYDAAEGVSKPQSSSHKAAPTSVARAPPVEERPRRSAQDRYVDRVGNRRLKEHIHTVEEELTGGRKEGRERQIEKRKDLSRKIHGAAQDREAAPELSDDRLYGNEQASFQTALAREKQRTAQREEKKNARIAELQKTENDKQEAMLKMLGLSNIQPGQKIQIAPRKDG